MVEHYREPELVGHLKEILQGGPYRLADYPGTGGAGGYGVALEHLLGMDANNISSGDAVEFELKTCTGDSLLSLFHKEPENQKRNAVGDMTALFGWAPKSAAEGSSRDLSFRHTITSSVSERGFRVVVKRKVVQVAFDPEYITPEHADWLRTVRERYDGELEGESIWLEWTRDELSRAMSHKMPNCVLVHGHKTGGHKKGQPDTREIKFYKIEVFKGLLLSRLYRGLKRGVVKIDIGTKFTVSKGNRNHGTKIRIRKGAIRSLYASNYAIS